MSSYLLSDVARVQGNGVVRGVVNELCVFTVSLESAYAVDAVVGARVVGTHGQNRQTRISTRVEPDADSRTFCVSYTPTLVGRYECHVSVRAKASTSSRPIAGSPFSVSISSRKPNLDPAKCRCAGLCTNGLVAGELSAFTILAHDERDERVAAGGECFTVRLGNPGPHCVYADVTDCGNGEYVCQYILAVAGQHMVQVYHHIDTVDSGTTTAPRKRVDATVIQGSPTKPYPQSHRNISRATPSKSPASTLNAGSQITPRSPTLSSGSRSTLVRSKSSSVSSPRASKAGSPRSPLGVGNDRRLLQPFLIPVNGFPSTVYVQHADCDGESCTLEVYNEDEQSTSSGAVHNCLSEEYVTVEIKSRDCYGNIATSPQAPLKFNWRLIALSDNSVCDEGACENLSNGLFVCGIRIGTAGQYHMHVQCHQGSSVVEIKDSPVLIHVCGSMQLDTKQCYATGCGAQRCTVGEQASLTIVARDKYRNRHTGGGLPILASISAPPASVWHEVSGQDWHLLQVQTELTPSHDTRVGLGPAMPVLPPDEPSVIDIGDGSYVVSYTVWNTGSAKLNVSCLNVGLLAISPLRPIASATSMDIRCSLIGGRGLSHSVVGESSTFRLVPRDSFGNLSICPLGAFTVDISPDGTSELQPCDKPFVVASIDADNVAGALSSNAERSVKMCAGVDETTMTSCVRVSYSVPVAGSYKLKMMYCANSAFGGSVLVFESSIIARACGVFGANCSAAGSFDDVSTTQPSTFTVNARDKFQNEVSVGGDDLKVSIWRSVAKNHLHSSRPSSPAGLLRVKSPSAAGRSRTPTGSSRSSPAQTPRPSSPLLRAGKGARPLAVQVGSPTMRAPSPRSRNASPRSFSHPRQSSLPCVLAIRDQNDGSYEVTWQPPTEGQYHVHVSFTNHNIKGSPFTASAK